MTRPPDARASLWRPLTVGALTLPHRLVMAAMGTGFATPEGRVSDRLVRYLARRAEGGVALVTTEATAVDGSGAPFPGVLRADEDAQLEGLRRLADRVHAHGAPIAMQLYHAGRQMSRRVSGRQPVGPSALECPMVRERPRALEGDEIGALIERFAEAAARARAAGFDAVELHGAHGYLIHQFLTPLANQRADGWGGDLAGRARFALAVVRQVRARLGPGVPILFKISAEDRLPGGLTLDDTLTVGRWLAEAGVDALVVSAGTYGSFEWIVQPIVLPPACLREHAARFRRAVAIPIVAVGRVNDPAVAADIVERGDADLVAMGRALLADPDLPRRARAGRDDEIRRCVTCNDCLAQLMRAGPIRCAVNPEVGREARFPLPAAPTPRRVVVVGGGPAGMQAALVARERGHAVTLLEAAATLGGQLRTAGRPSWTRERGTLAPYLERRLAAAGVVVRLGAAATVQGVAGLTPDVVVVATGARRVLPAIPGLEGPQVQTAEQCLASEPDGRGAAVVLGGGITASEVAGHLGEGGWTVTVLAPERELARDAESMTRRTVVAELARLGVRVVRQARVEAIDADQVRFRDEAGRLAAAPAGRVIVAPERAPDDRLRAALDAAGIPARAVGDCRAPTDLAGAIHDATEVAAGL